MVASEDKNQNYDNYHYFDQRGLPVNFNGNYKNNSNIDGYQRLRPDEQQQHCQVHHNDT
jgi:hypothetical protein